MNCEKGDLAYIIKTEEPNSPALGKVVECYSMDGEHSLYGPMWLVRVNGKPVVTTHGTSAITFHHPDDWLRPLRGNPGTDETLTWAPVPNKETA